MIMIMMIIIIIIMFTMQQRLGCSTQVVAITAWSFPANLSSFTYLDDDDMMIKMK